MSLLMLDFVWIIFIYIHLIKLVAYAWGICVNIENE